MWDKVAWPTGDMVLECWLWTGAKSKKRRGQVRPVVQIGTMAHPKVVLVSRLVCEWYNGPPPTPEHEAGHTCPLGERCLCINPHHLTWQTREENENYKRRGTTNHHDNADA